MIYCCGNKVAVPILGGKTPQVFTLYFEHKGGIIQIQNFELLLPITTVEQRVRTSEAASSDLGPPPDPEHVDPEANTEHTCYRDTLGIVKTISVYSKKLKLID